MKKSILFAGQSFYHCWYLSRELRKLGWQADVLNFDANPSSQMFYHGEDFRLEYKFTKENGLKNIEFYLNSLLRYQIFHFSNSNGIYFLNKSYDLRKLDKLNPTTQSVLTWVWKYLLKDGKRLDRAWRLITKIGLKRTSKLIYHYSPYFADNWDIRLIKLLGKKITYSNNACLDGVSQTSFSKWKTAIENESVCDICIWKNQPTVCSDEKNLSWGKFRNEMTDYQFLLGGNRADYNIGTNILEMPYTYCLDKNLWNPDMLVPSNYQLPIPADTVKIYHAVGNFDNRSSLGIHNIKSTHIYIPLVDKLKNEGYKVELIFFKDVPNVQVRYYQLQADIFVDMLTYGFFGSNIREGMMLGKVCICYLRPEWLEQMRAEIPEYVDELPIVNANPNNIEEVLKDLIGNKEKCLQIGRKSRDFAVKWHSSENAAKFFDSFYTKIIAE